MKLELLHQQIEPIIKQAGKLLLSYFHQQLNLQYKTDGSYATQADIETERFLLQNLKPLIPGAGFYAEESGAVAGNEYCWVIDPLDGTTNFAHGLPYFCISIGLTFNDTPVAGFIYQPLLDEYFYAATGHGAFCNGKKLAVSTTSELKDAVAIFAYPYQENQYYLQQVLNISLNTSSSRTFGAAALDQAYCAAGKVDLVLFRDLSWWDVAAGIVLITEAGGQVGQFDGRKMDKHFSSYIGANKLIFEKVKNLLQ